MDLDVNELNAMVSALDYETRKNRQDIDSMVMVIRDLANQPSAILIRDDMQHLHETVMGLLGQISDIEKRLSQTEEQVDAFAVTQLL